MIVISKTNYKYLLDGNAVTIKDNSTSNLVTIKFENALVKVKNHVKKKLPVSLTTRAGLTTK